MIHALPALLPLLFAAQVGGSWQPAFEHSPAGLDRPFQTADLVPDLDGDGIDDLLVGSPAAVVQGMPHAGAVLVLSGATGDLLYLLEGTAADESLGRQVHCPGDLDGDGVADLLVTHFVAPEERVLLLSGRTGSTIFEIAEPALAGWDVNDFGTTLGSVADLDGDGVREILIGAPASRPSTTSAQPGAAFLYSGASGAALRHHLGIPGSEDRLGAACAELGDVDGDGVADYALSSVQPGQPASTGLVRLHSGATGAALRELHPPAGVIGFGSSLDGGHDLDGDGVADLLVGAPGFTVNQAFAISGATGATLATVAGGPTTRFGWAVAFAGDLSGSGTSEFLVGAPLESVVRLYDAGGHLLHESAFGPTAIGYGTRILGEATFDLDGVPDRAVLAPGEGALGQGSGALRTIAGATQALIGWFPGAREHSWAGAAVAIVGDWDGDGVADFACGLPLASTSGRPAAGAVEVRSGRDFRVLHRWDGDEPNARLGFSLAAGGDHDGDGQPDLFAGAPYAPDASGVAVGAVVLRGSATGGLLGRWQGASERGEFGGALACFADADGDGLRELAIGAPGPHWPQAQGEVVVLSPGTGTILGNFSGKRIDDGYGTAVAAGQDANGDGIQDLVIGAPGRDGGYVEIRSGRDGALLHAIQSPGSGTSESFGAAVAWLGDLDGDAAADFAAGSPGANTTARDSGAAFVFSGRTGARLFQWNGSLESGAFGTALSACGDVDRDGTPDLAVAETARQGVQGSVRLYSGATGAVIRLLPGELGFRPTRVHAGDDADGDGVIDLFLGDPIYDSERGRLRLLRYDGFLALAAAQVSASAGGTIPLALDFPASEGGMLYAVLASASGIGPLPIAGVEIPLGFDALLLASLRPAAGVYLPDHWGRLDPQGDRALTLSFPPGVLAPLVGRTIHLAALSGSDRWTGRLASAARPLAVGP